MLNECIPETAKRQVVTAENGRITFTSYVNLNSTIPPEELNVIKHVYCECVSVWNIHAVLLSATGTNYGGCLQFDGRVWDRQQWVVGSCENQTQTERTETGMLLLLFFLVQERGKFFFQCSIGR